MLLYNELVSHSQLVFHHLIVLSLPPKSGLGTKSQNALQNVGLLAESQELIVCPPTMV